MRDRPQPVGLRHRGSLDDAWLPDYTPLYFGLDFFVLNVAFTACYLYRLRRCFLSTKNNRCFAVNGVEDLFYYFVSSMMVQVLTFISLGPAKYLLANTNWDGFRSWVAALPLVVQVIAIIFFTDLVQYWLHRAFHRIPFLWRFHAVHHSAKSMDWMAGARMHFVEICILRGTHRLTDDPARLFHDCGAYLYLHGLPLVTFAHANLGWRFRWIDQLLVVPRFHHWHHGIEKEAIDVNFAVHFPWLDRLFGTYHMPKDRWPEGYGISDHPVPNGYVPQMLYPFKSDNSAPLSNPE